MSKYHQAAINGNICNLDFMPTKSKTKPTKKPKKRANKYEEKLQINGTFEDLVKELITPTKKK